MITSSIKVFFLRGRTLLDLCRLQRNISLSRLAAILRIFFFWWHAVNMLMAAEYNNNVRKLFYVEGHRRTID